LKIFTNLNKKVMFSSN